jgi:lipopolysaccharide heptosyltransferase II
MIDFNNKKILITRLKFIGDIVLTTPLIKTLKVNYPTSQLFYMAEKEAISLLMHNPDLSGLIPLDFNISIIEYLKFINKLRKYKFDIVIDLFGNPRSALLTFLSGAKVRIGGDFKCRGKLFTHRISESDDRKDQISYHLGFIENFGVQSLHKKTKIYLNSHEQDNALKILTATGIDVKSRMIGIYPGATWPAKRWFPEKFALLADDLYRDLNAQVVFFQGIKDSDIIKEIIGKSNWNHFYLDPQNLRTTANLISIMDVFISNDCGLMHIAPAVDTRTIGLFGPGEEDIWFPYLKEDGHIAIRKDIWCHPCHLDVCNRMDCWKLLDISEVVEATGHVLKMKVHGV